MNNRSILNINLLLLLRASKFFLRTTKVTMVKQLLFTGIILLSFHFTNAQRFVAIGDYGVNDQNELAVSDLVKSLNPEFIITTGDNNYPIGAASTIDQNVGKYYREFIYPYVGNYGQGATENRFYPVVGNHDNETNNGQPFRDYFTLPGNERYYDFVKGDVHFFGLNTDAREPDGNKEGSIQAQWLETQLANSTSKWKIVYMHVAPYCSGGHGSSDTVQWPFKEWGADVVIAGHNHLYERLIVDDLPYFVVGTGGRRLSSYQFQLLESKAIYKGFGALYVEASPTQLLFEFLDTNSVIIDSYTIPDEDNSNANTVVAQIANGLDDVEENENNGNVYHDSQDLELGYDGLFNQGYQTLGLRFQNIEVPAGVTITKAHIQFVAENTGSTNCAVDITGHLAGNSNPFDLGTPYSVSNRPRTNSSVHWQLDSWDFLGSGHQSPDLSAIIQEIIDHPNWSSSNAISLLVKGSMGTREAESFEGNYAKAPQLLIEYEFESIDLLTTSQINSGSLDAEESESSGFVYMNSTDIELGYDSYNQQNNQISGLRFPNLHVPEGATITQAYIEWTVDAISTDACALNIWAEKSSNSLAFNNSQSHNLSSRSRTNNQLNWNPPAWTQVGAAQQSPDLSPILQEVLDEPGWTPGNSVNFFIQGSQGTRESESYEGSPRGAAKLVVHYRADNAVLDVIATISGPKDDVEENESNGTVYTNSSDIELGFDAYNKQNYQTVGLRYQDINIPAGAYILSAHLDFTVDKATGSVSQLEIHGDKQANSAEFDDMAFYDVSTRTKTNTKVDWSPSSWTQVGDVKSSPDLADIVQEIVNQGTWTSGNALSFIIKGTSGTREAESYEAGAHLAARLRIQFQTTNPGRESNPTLALVSSEESPLDNMIIYPNPNLSNGPLNLSFEKGIEGQWQVEFYSVLGELVGATTINLDQDSELVQLTTPDLPAGSYQVSMRNHRFKKSFKLIIQ